MFERLGGHRRDERSRMLHLANLRSVHDSEVQSDELEDEEKERWNPMASDDNECAGERRWTLLHNGRTVVV